MSHHALSTKSWGPESFKLCLTYMFYRDCDTQLLHSKEVTLVVFYRYLKHLETHWRLFFAVFFRCRYSHVLLLIKYDRETTHELPSRKLRVETRIGLAATEEIRNDVPLVGIRRTGRGDGSFAKAWNLNNSRMVMVNTQVSKSKTGKAVNNNFNFVQGGPLPVVSRVVTPVFPCITPFIGVML